MGRKKFQAGPLSSVLGSLIRESLVIPQAELARRTKVSHDTVSRWLDGERPINIEDLVLICEACDLDIINLIAKAQALISGAVDLPEGSSGGAVHSKRHKGTGNNNELN